MSGGFDLDEARAVLSRTPGALDALLRGLPGGWTSADEGPGTWSPRGVVGHLIHGERTDWMTRVRRILSDRASEPFEPFDRAGHEAATRGARLDDLLDEFARLRAESLAALEALRLSPADLDRRGVHPDFGPVTLRQLLATWTVHDLGHLAQVSRAMAKRWREEVGPWRAYLPVLDRR